MLVKFVSGACSVSNNGLLHTVDVIANWNGQASSHHFVPVLQAQVGLSNEEAFNQETYLYSDSQILVWVRPAGNGSVFCDLSFSGVLEDLDTPPSL